MLNTIQDVPKIERIQYPQSLTILKHVVKVHTPRRKHSQSSINANGFIGYCPNTLSTEIFKEQPIDTLIYS